MTRPRLTIGAGNMEKPYADPLPFRRHSIDKLARAVYATPAGRPLIRRLVRAAIQRSPLSLTNRQRLYNFFAEDVSPVGAHIWQVKVPRGGHVTLELDLTDSLSRQWYFWGFTPGGYETGTTTLFANLVRSKRCIFDVGANIGYYTLLAAALMGDRAELHAFEPWSEVFHCPRTNVKRNEYHRLRLNKLALSDTNGQETLFLPADPAARTNASLVPGFVEQSERVLVETMRFDTYCARHGVGPVDLIRVDAEGSEVKVLRGMGDLLDRWLPDIVCEVLSGFEQELDDVFSDKPYNIFLVTDTGLRKVDRIEAHPRFRDYFLTTHSAPPEMDR